MLESTRDTISIHHGANATAEKTTVDTNPQKVLEHSNLLTEYGISKKTIGNTTKLGLEYTQVNDGFDLNNLTNGNVRASNLTNAPSKNEEYYIQSFGDTTGDNIIQTAFTRVNSLSESANVYRRYKINNEWGVWRRLLRNKEELDNLLSTKQDTLVPGDGITIQGNTISATGGATSTVQYFISTYYRAYEHRVETSDGPLLTFSFECYNTAETVSEGALKKDLGAYVLQNKSISNGAISITYDGTTMKLINSAPSENINQHGTFTFYGETVTGGGGES